MKVEKSSQDLESEIIYAGLCIHCGSCTAVCFAGALVLKKPEWKLKFDPNLCIVCELCTKTCPLGLFKIDFGDTENV